MPTSSPPLPPHLREILKEYPAHLAELQSDLDYVVATPFPAIEPLDRTLWLLQSTLESFISEARAALKVALHSGDAAAIALARARKDLMLRAASRNIGLRDLDALREYLKADTAASA